MGARECPSLHTTHAQHDHVQGGEGMNPARPWTHLGLKDSAVQVNFAACTRGTTRHSSCSGRQGQLQPGHPNRHTSIAHSLFKGGRVMDFMALLLWNEIVCAAVVLPEQVTFDGSAVVHLPHTLRHTRSHRTIQDTLTVLSAE